MHATAYALVLVSTATHAYWNYLLKRSSGGTVFVGLSKLAEMVVFAPLFLWWVSTKPVSWHGAAPLVIIGAALVLANYAALARAYQLGDFSIVYPVSRGGALLFLPALGYMIFGERLSLIGGIALAFVIFGMMVLQLPELSMRALRGLAKHLRSGAIVFALGAALAAAIYTVWDKRAIRALPPFIYFYVYTSIVALVYGGFVVARYSRVDVRDTWRRDWWAIVRVGVCNTITYLLVLFALSEGNSSYVIGLRQLSIAWTVLFGAMLLGESFGPSRKLGTALIVAGCVLVAVAGVL